MQSRRYSDNNQAKQKEVKKGTEGREAPDYTDEPISAVELL
jgi:hypothetical protein